MPNRTCRLPISNKGPTQLQVGIEPEGDCIPLAAGESLEIHYSEPGAELELVLEGDLLSVYCSTTQEVWRAGKRRW